MKRIGIFALQGDFHKHSLAVQSLGFEAIHVKDAKTLAKCDKLIIPGGESTTFMNLINRLELNEVLVEYGKSRPVLGTCAGLIILAKHVDSLPFETLGLIDIHVARNAYGRQINSFIDTVRLTLGEETIDFEGVFIRAPRITAPGNGIRQLGFHKDDLVMAASDNILVATFHPELTDDLRVHRYFIENFG
ncbi:MAG: pyridoxal 5'-phosphate synthase glutaminase subunit PdxT [Calditrichaceae bacterium]